MTAFVIDTSIIIDVLRGNQEAASTLRDARRRGQLYASEITRTEVLSGMRTAEEERTRGLLQLFVWRSVDEAHAELAGKLGRDWLPKYRGIDSADLVIAATASLLDARLLTRNVKHFPMFERLTSPY